MGLSILVLTTCCLSLNHAAVAATVVTLKALSYWYFLREYLARTYMTMIRWLMQAEAQNLYHVRDSNLCYIGPRSPPSVFQ